MCIGILWAIAAAAAVTASVTTALYIKARKAGTGTQSEFIRLETLIGQMQKENDRQNAMINELAKLHSDTVEYDRQKTEFFSNIVHELKTPLSVIMGAVQLIEQKRHLLPPDEGKYIKHLHSIKQNCLRLIKLVGNILDMAKVDAGYTVLNLADHNLVRLAEDITQSVVPYAYQKKIQLMFSCGEEEIITAVDAEKIERIMLNLLSNAIKFNRSGGSVSVFVRGTGGKALISVKDTGPGIPQDKHEAIFERFHQVKGALTSDAGGTGIGLSLVKSFVDMHGGTISVISEEGRGSEFIVEIPLKRIGPAREIAPDSAAFADRDRLLETINVEFADMSTSAMDKSRSQSCMKTHTISS